MPNDVTHLWLVATNVCFLFVLAILFLPCISWAFLARWKCRITGVVDYDSFKYYS